MELFWIIFCIAWVVGWVRMLAVCDRIVRRVGFEFPSEKVKKAIPVVLFFTWPYFYFFHKA